MARCPYCGGDSKADIPVETRCESCQRRLVIYVVAPLKPLVGGTLPGFDTRTEAARIASSQPKPHDVWPLWADPGK